MGPDDGITLVPARICRAVLTCTTCNTVVAVGPPVTGDVADAAYLLGVIEGGQHFGVCAGGAITVTVEQEPFAQPAAARAPAPRRLRSVR